MKCDESLLAKQNETFGSNSLFFPAGKESFEDGLNSVDLSVFGSYEEAYTKLMIDLTDLCITAINLVIPQNDSTSKLYISGGFARNPIYIHLLKEHFSQKEIITSEIDNASALGAALVVADVVGFKPDIKLALD